ncbi:HRAS-like suppressor 3, partial [Alligator sinensis]|uniref:HRAS-like suppressor 3 n=1 Tax=Alligator sinensis TaxID=38654 RepID=A0A3Q0HFK1_ALLSI
GPRGAGSRLLPLSRGNCSLAPWRGGAGRGAQRPHPTLLFLPQPQPGDLIQIFRPPIEHWALYVGDGYVIHVAPVDGRGGASPAWLSSSSAGRAMVKKERLRDILRGGKYRVNNKYDKTRAPRPVEEILAKAEAEVGKKMFYNVFLQNCEHFVTELRYGRSISHQVQDGVTSVVVGSLLCVSPWLCVMGIAVVGVYVFLRES